jgi:AcrR family transcriptional regulator
MTSRASSQETPRSGASRPAKRVRRSAQDRRAEIVEAARRTALRDGLENVTLRSLGEELGVAGSLVSHYFPAVDDLLAEAFAAAAGDEIAQVFDGLGADSDPVTALGAILRFTVDADRAEVTRLWIDAWHIGRRRPSLQAEVIRQTDRWTDRLGAVIAHGLTTGSFRLTHAADPREVAAQIMAVIDGLTVQSTLRGTIGYDAVARLGFSVAEAQLGLAEGTLDPAPSGVRAE